MKVVRFVVTRLKGGGWAEFADEVHRLKVYLRQSAKYPPYPQLVPGSPYYAGRPNREVA